MSSGTQQGVMMLYHKKRIIFFLLILVIACVGYYYIYASFELEKKENVSATVLDPKEQKIDKSYGVFLGVEDVSNIKGYDLVVIDAYYLDKETIDNLHKNNNKVFTYLNIGTIENYRDSYEKFKNDAFDNYDDWPEEYWMDTSLDSWNDYLVEKAKEYKEMGIDGFFLDNTDVYAQYPETKIYNGLVRIIDNLNKNDLPLIINGGDVFVSKAIQANEVQLYGVNQETIFTSINFDKKTLGKSKEEDREYYKNYVAFCSDNNLQVFLLEYTKEESIKKEIENYCKSKGYLFYISSTIELLGD